MICTSKSFVRPFPRRSQHGTPSLVLSGGWVALDASTSVRADVEIVNGHVSRLIKENRSDCAGSKTPSSKTSAKISVAGCLILPGLINSHDHLEFNLFPRLGHGPYPNFEKWALDIYHPERSPIREQLAIPKATRLWWGGLKNLLSGVTTVCHHNRFETDIFSPAFPIQVVREYGWAHSLRFGKDVIEAFLSTPPRVPFVIHLAEGSDRKSGHEIFDLERLGILDSRTVVVHGVGLTGYGRDLVRRREAGLVWCPTSNRFTLGTTLGPDFLESYRRISLGNDSALTAEGDLLDEIRAARREGVCSERIYSMVTDAASDVLKLRKSQGKLHPGERADLFVVQRKGIPPAEELIETRLKNIEMVMVSGEPRMLSTKMAHRCPAGFTEKFEEIEVGGTRCFVRAPVKELLKETERFLGSDVRLGGKRVTL